VRARKIRVPLPAPEPAAVPAAPPHLLADDLPIVNTNFISTDNCR